MSKRRVLSIKMIIIAIILISVAVLFSSQAIAAHYFVAKKDGSDRHPGTEAKPWCTIHHASKQLQPGDTLHILDGNYLEQIRPDSSGTVEQPIRYVGQGNNVRFLLPSGENAVIELSDRQHIIIDSIIVDGRSKGMWVNAGWGIRGHYTIQNCTFVNPDNSQYGIYLEAAPYNKLLKNYLTHGAPGSRTGTDAIMLTESSDYTLVEGNIIENAMHAGLKVESSFVIIRDNKFLNIFNQAAESGGGRPGHHNIVWEYNTFTNKGQWGIDPEPAQGIQFYTKDSIVRYNIFYNCAGGGLTVEGYHEEANVVTNNRFYNNAFVNNRQLSGVHLVAWETGVIIKGNVFKNNLFYRNSGKNFGMSEPQPIQLLITEYYGSDLIKNNYFCYNNFWNEEASNSIISHRILGNHKLSWWQTHYPENFVNNLEIEPGIVEEKNYDFYLHPDSRLIDSGDFLTKTVVSGNGNKVAVEDSKFFTDGFGIVEGDEVIVGTNSPVRIKNIDYEQNLFTIDRKITWNRNDSVSLIYHGSAPNIGAFEFGKLRNN